MEPRSLLWNLVRWNPSFGPADPYGAPRFAHIAWAVRSRWWPLLVLIAGALLMVTGLMWVHSAVAFIAGTLLVAASVPAAAPHSATGAMVRTWKWLYERNADQR